MTELNKLLCPPSMNLDDSVYISELIVAEGQVVTRDQILAILVSGDHILEYSANEDCIIQKIHCYKGQKVTPNFLLFKTRPK